MWAVLQRELRSESRNPGFRRLRLLAVLTVVVVLGLFLSQVSGLGAQSGTYLFVVVHVTVGVSLLALCPLLTADCLSRERREGTLGLLFLTSMSPREIVLGKAAIHFLRAFTLWLAVVPVMSIPFLFGGVSASAILLAFVVEASVAAITLCSGIYASVLTRRASVAVLLAYGLSAGWLGAMWLLGGAVLALLRLSRLNPGEVLPACVFGLLALGVAFLHLWMAAVRLPLLWRSDTQPTRRPAPSALMSPPKALEGWVRRRRLGMLSRNPLVWLQTRYLPSALGRWGWVWLVGVAWILQLDGSWGLNHLFYGIWLARGMESLLLFGMVAVSARALHAERQAGTLELLLVSPIRIGQLRLSVARSIWHQFVPAMVLDLAVWSYLQTIFDHGIGELGPDPLLISSLFTLPFIGAWCAARQTHFLSALLSTGLVGVAIPVIVPALWTWAGRLCHWAWEGWAANGSIPPALELSSSSRGWSVLVQLLLSAWAIGWLNREFQERRFIVREVAA